MVERSAHGTKYPNDPCSGPRYGGLTFKNRGHLGSRCILNLYPGSPKTKERMVFL